MCFIPLAKYREMMFPETAKSTINFWANDAFYKDTGLLAGLISLKGKRWYVTIEDEKLDALKARMDQIFSEGH